MKRVNYTYGCRNLGDHTAEIYVPENMTKEQILQMLEKEIDFGIYINRMEDGYEEAHEVVYRKVR